MDYRIFPPEEILETTISLPAAKSMAVRAAALAFLAGQKTETHSATSADAAVAANVFGRLARQEHQTIDAGESGAVLRFACAIAAATPGCDIVLDGCESLRRRPIATLVDALRRLGAEIDYCEKADCVPLRIKGRRLDGGVIDVDASESSQFISALMLAAPLMSAGLTINLGPTVQSAPYIRLTARMMADHGIDVEVERDKVSVSAGKYKPCDDTIEADWSAACFWYEIAALTAGWVTLAGLPEHTCQADRGAAALFERLGVLTEFTDEGAELSATPDLYSSLDADMTDMPDAVPALVVTAALAGLPFRLAGVGALHAKECDRIEALIAELQKIGVLAETENYGNTLVWDGRRLPILEMPDFDSHGDHRMAMALAPVSIFVPGIVVRGAECVEKSYPGFWQALADAGFKLVDPAEPFTTEQ